MHQDPLHNSVYPQTLVTPIKLQSRPRIRQAEAGELVVAQPRQRVVLLAVAVGWLALPSVQGPDVHSEVGSLDVSEGFPGNLGHDAELFA